MLPAVGQGALGLEVRANDDFTRHAVSQLNDEDTMHTTKAERMLLASLRGGCMAPVAARAQVRQNQVEMDAVVLSSDGKQRLDVNLTDQADNAQHVGKAAAQVLLNDGADALIAESRG